MTDDLKSDPARPASEAKPEPPEELWGVWLPKDNAWHPFFGTVAVDRSKAAAERSAATGRTLGWDAVPALIGVAPRYRAQVERLRAALNMIVSRLNELCEDGSWSMKVEQIWDDARAALAETDPVSPTAPVSASTTGEEPPSNA